MIKSLISLRGIFILFIFFHHCLALYPGGGSMAVTFFFVLGGFAMTLGYKDKVLSPDFAYKQYLVKRFIKFYPLHWLCILAVIPIVVLSMSWKYIPVLALNATLLQTWIPIKSVYFSFNSVSWYLADTVFFAAVFPLLIKWIINATPKGRIGIAALFTIIYVLVVILVPNGWYHAVLYISPYVRLTDFVLGIFLALGFLRLKNKPKMWWTGRCVGQIMSFVLIVLLVIESCLLGEKYSLIAAVYWPVVVLLILTASLTEYNGGGGNWLQNRLLQFVGGLSFIIFMIHQIILRYTTVVFEKILHVENDVIYVVFTLSFTIIASIIVEKFILNPITQWLTKRIQPSMIAQS